MQYHYANPPRSLSKREQEELNPHHWFWRPACCQLHHAPRCADSEPTPTLFTTPASDRAHAVSGAEGGNRTHSATGTNGFTDRRNSILPPQHKSKFERYSIVKNQRGANPFRTKSSEAAAPLGLVKAFYFWRFRERESAPALSTLTTLMIGELLISFRPVATYVIDVRQVHIEL